MKARHSIFPRGGGSLGTGRRGRMEGMEEMGSELKKLQESMIKGLVHSSYWDTLCEIERVMDESLDATIQQMMSELSGAIVTRLADELEARGIACGGHKVVQGFSSNEAEGV